MANTYFDFDGHIYHPVYFALDCFGNYIQINPSLDTVAHNFDYSMYDGFDTIGNELDFGY